jgi:hypothetical protein
MKGIDAAIFFSFGGGVGVDPGSGAKLQCGRKKKVAGWPCGWAGPAGRPRPSGGGEEEKNIRLKKKEKGPWLGRQAGWAESDGENSFPNKI